MPISEVELNEELSKMSEVYGEKAFLGQRRTAIWDVVKDLEPVQVRALVKHFIVTMRHAPLPKDFADASAMFRRGTKRYALGELQPYDVCACKDCADSGFVRVRRLPGHARWAKFETGSAACHCERGKMLSEAMRRSANPTAMQQYGDDWRSSYEIIPEYDRPPTLTRGEV